MKVKFNFKFGFISVLLLSLICGPRSWAGEPASIFGVVLDPSGAVVAGASVTLQSLGDGPEQQRVTSDDGSFSFPALTPGEYRIRVEAAGFRPYAQTVLTGTVPLRVDAQLVLNSESTVVEVSAQALEADLTSTQLGETIAGKKMTSVPLNGRSVTDLLAIQPGIVPTSSQQPNAVMMSGCAAAPPSGDLNPGNLSVSGQRETANGFMVNGSTVQEAFNMGTAIVPNLDSIQEFRVLTSNFDAEYGNYSGGQVMVVTKSGANQLHGSAFEFLRNTDLDARNYFSSERATFDQNQFGGTLGGPLKKDKLFFFIDYQGTRMTQGVDTGLISVPSLQERTGNLSDLGERADREGKWTISGQACSRRNLAMR